MLLQITLVSGVILLIICLVVRDQTEYRISRLRSEFMFLRSEEKRLAERRDEVELMVSQIGDGLIRADRRRDAIERSADAMDDLLDRLQKVIAEGDDGGQDFTVVASEPADRPNGVGTAAAHGADEQAADAPSEDPPAVSEGTVAAPSAEGDGEGSESLT